MYFYVRKIRIRSNLKMLSNPQGKLSFHHFQIDTYLSAKKTIRSV